MLNISTAKQKVTRTAKAKLQLMIEGTLREQEVSVVYESLSVKDAREAKARADMEKSADNKSFYLSEILINNLNLKRLPDFSDDEGNEVEVTLEMLEDFDLYNLKAIQKAILDDTDPK